MEEYINAAELSSRIKEKKQTIYNRIYKKEFLPGIHYVKPTPKKLLFKWSAIVLWLEGPEQTLNDSTEFFGPKIDSPPITPSEKEYKNAINI